MRSRLTPVCSSRPAVAACAAGMLLVSSVVLAAQDAHQLYRDGAQAQAAGDWYRAIEFFRDALAANPSYLEPSTGLAECFLALEDFDEAARWVAQARQLDRSNLDLVALAGRVSLGRGDVAGARTLFNQVLASQPNNAEARFGLAEADLAEGKVASARGLLDQVLRVAPESKRALLSLAMLTDSQGDHTLAGRYIDMALRSHAADPQVQLAASDHYASLGRWDLAERYARVALALAPGSPAALMDIATAQMGAGANGKAAESLRQIVSARPSDDRAWYTLGVAYLRSGESAKALEALSRSVGARPDDEVARMVEEDVAIDSLKESDPVRVKLAGYHAAAGATLEARSLLEKALDEYRRAIMLDPVSRDARLGLARVYRLLGLPGKQLDELEAFSQLGLKDAAVSDQIEALQSERADSVSNQWGYNQYAIERKRFKIPVSTVPGENVILHPLSAEYLARYLRECLERYDSLDLPRQQTVTSGFDAAFAAARQSGADYFILVSLQEAERSFGATLTLYLGRTGARVASWSAFRTGNDRVRDTFERLATQLASALPAWGTLLARKLDQGLVDLGVAQGIKVGDKLAIVRSGSVHPASEAPALWWDPVDAIGDFTVTAVDEAMSQGTIARRGTFDFVNVADEVVIAPSPAPSEAPSASPAPPTGLLGRLFGLRGR